MASTGMVVLSVLISKSTSPFFTVSPTRLCHLTNWPSSILKPSLGMMMISAMTLLHSHQNLDRMLQQLLHILHELGGQQTVNDPVIHRQLYVHHGPDGDGVLSVLAGDHNGGLAHWN